MLSFSEIIILLLIIESINDLDEFIKENTRNDITNEDNTYIDNRVLVFENYDDKEE